MPSAHRPRARAVNAMAGDPVKAKRPVAGAAAAGPDEVGGAVPLRGAAPDRSSLPPAEVMVGVVPVPVVLPPEPEVGVVPVPVVFPPEVQSLPYLSWCSRCSLRYRGRVQIRCHVNYDAILGAHPGGSARSSRTFQNVQDGCQSLGDRGSG